jgi:putative transposase
VPWKETEKMDQKIEFVLKAQQCSNFRELCREFSISTKTGYKWKERFLQHGLNGMTEESRRPKSHSKELSESVVCEIISLKEAHRHWGPRKIHNLYERKHKGQEIPSESSFKRVLERAGLTTPRKRRRARESGRLAEGRKAEAVNEVWTVDFKGWWKDREGLRVEPLTLRDEYSCMLLEMRAVASTRTETIKLCFERIFEQFGLPKAIRSDNGPPFASSNGLLGLSRLSVWWLALGIDLERGRPGKPQDNGAHERMHLDISKELQAGRIGRDQDAFDLWRHEFNYERPHEALGMDRPSEHYRPSERKYIGTPDELDYGGMDTRKVHPSGGHISYHGETIALSSSLGGWNVGISPTQNDLIEVWFASLLLGHIDPETSSFASVDPTQKGAATGHSADSAPLHQPSGRSNAQETGKPEPKV